jgi:signal peptidase II
MLKKLKFIGPVALIVYGLDHLTKWWIVANLPRGDRITVIAGFFDIVHGRNTGAAFGFLAGWDSPHRDLFFYAIALVALTFLFFYIRSVPLHDRITLGALAFILSGAAGNITDRIVRGSVVDFISVHYYNEVWIFSALGRHFVVPLTWPAFNVADAAISTAVVWLIVVNFRKPAAARAANNN